MAATHRNLTVRVAERQFRDDLYFRLSVFPIRIPPLRERAADITMLARYFADRFARDLNRVSLTIAPAALDALSEYSWPGNVRELQNCIERAAILCEDGTIHLRNLNLPRPQASGHQDAGDDLDLSGTLAEALRRGAAAIERRKLQQALGEAGGDESRAAQMLGVSGPVLARKLDEHGIARVSAAGGPRR